MEFSMESIDAEVIMYAVENYIADHEELCDDGTFCVTGAPAWNEDTGRWEVPAEDAECAYSFVTVPDGYGDWDVQLEYNGSRQ